MRLEIADDGIGFDPEAARSVATEGHFGLQLMADVTASVGGTLAVSNNHGTRLRMEIPAR